MLGGRFVGAPLCPSGVSARGVAGAAAGSFARGVVGQGCALVPGRRGFGFGDVTSWAIVGCALGVVVGVQVVAAGSIIGSFVVVGLIVARVVSRRVRVPMALLTYVGMVAVMVASTVGVQR